MGLRGRAALALVAVLPVGLSASVQEGADEAGVEESAAQRPPVPLFESPRELVDAFLDSMRDGELERALATFEGWDGQVGTPWTQYAEDLYFAVQRTELIRVDALPGSDYPRSLWTLELRSPSRPNTVVRLVAVRGEEGGWRFSARRTLARAAQWRAALADLPPIQEVLERLPLLERWHWQLEQHLPEALRKRAFLVANWKWLGLFFLTFLAVAVDRLVRWAIGTAARRSAHLRGVRLDPEALLGFERPAGMLVGVVVFERLLAVLLLPPGVLSTLLLATSFVATVAGVWATYRLVDVFCDYLTVRAARTSNRFDDMLVPLVRRTLKLFVLVVGIVFVASRLSEDLWGVVAGLGIGSLAVGFAARDSIENLFGTFTVLLDKPFQIGDWIRTGDFEGTVEQVGFRSTRIRTFYDSLITVPNRTFISTNVDNMGERRYRRIKTLLSLTYGTPPERIEAFCEGVRQIVRSHPYTRKDYYHVYLNAFGPSSLDILLYCFVAAPDWGTELREKHRLFADILRLAEALGVEFAFPTQTVHLAGDGEPEEPDDRPATDAEGARRGRQAADAIVARTLEPYGGNKPPPVTIPTRPVGGDEG